MGIIEVLTANKARNLSISDHIKIPYTDYKSVIHHYVFSTWQTDWMKDIGNKLFTVKPSVSSKFPFTVFIVSMTPLLLDFVLDILS